MTKKQSYTDEFKQGAVALVIEQGLSVAEVGRRLGTSSKNVSRWVADSKTPAVNNTVESELLAKIKKLEKENKILHMERELLKKAATFFAKESS